MSAFRNPGKRLTKNACATGLALAATLALTGAWQEPSSDKLTCYKAELAFERVQTPTAQVWIAKSETIVESRLLPKELWKLEQPIVLDGATVLNAGAQLISMRSIIPTRCSIPQMRPGLTESRKRVCVFDIDKDGVFDRINVRERGGIYWLAMSWKHPPTVATAPVSMSPLNVTEFQNGPRIRAFIRGTKALKQLPTSYDALMSITLSGPDGAWFPMCLRKNSDCTRISRNEMAELSGFAFRLNEIEKDRFLVSYHQNFDAEFVNLPYLNSYEQKCDTFVPRY